MNHLHELLDHDIDLLYRPKILELETARTLHNEFSKLAQHAVCFAMGDTGSMDGLAQIEELSKRLPYPTCWFEASVDDGGQPSLLIGYLAHTMPSGAIRIYTYERTGQRWSMANVAQVDRVWSTEAAICPKCEKTVGQVFLALSMLRAFLSAMNCMNVSRKENRPSTKLQKARKGRGKALLFSYWTLILNGRSLSEHHGGTHASPRVHLRRGHPRQYALGKWTWVQPCAVGNRAAGMVHKDYRAGKRMLPPV